MKSFWSSFKAIFVKDILTEFRSKQVLPTMIVMGMLIVWIFRITAEAASIDMTVLGPIALWIALLFSSIIAQEKSFATEQQQDCISGLLLAVDADTIYISKLFVNNIMLCIFEIVIVPVVFFFFKLDLHGKWLTFIFVLLLGNLGISGVGTLFSAIVQLTRTKGSLLSIIVLVILMPMMIPAIFALLVLFGSIPEQLIGTGALAFVGSFNNAIVYMCVFDAVFIVACWLLFGFVIKE